MGEDAVDMGGPLPVFSAAFVLLGTCLLFRSKPVTLGSVIMSACVSACAAALWGGASLPEPSALKAAGTWLGTDLARAFGVAPVRV